MRLPEFWAAAESREGVAMSRVCTLILVALSAVLFSLSASAQEDAGDGGASLFPAVLVVTGNENDMFSFADA